MEFIYSLKLLSKRAWALLGRPRCLIEASSNSHVKSFFSPQLTVSDSGKEEKERDSTKHLDPVEPSNRPLGQTEGPLSENARPSTKPHCLATLSRLNVASVLLILRELC